MTFNDGASILKIKDLYFDIPKAHSIKNLITGLFVDVDEKVYEPSHFRTHRNYYLFNRMLCIFVIFYWGNLSLTGTASD